MHGKCLLSFYLKVSFRSTFLKYPFKDTLGASFSPPRFELLVWRFVFPFSILRIEEAAQQSYDGPPYTQLPSNPLLALACKASPIFLSPCFQCFAFCMKLTWSKLSVISVKLELLHLTFPDCALIN